MVGGVVEVIVVVASFVVVFVVVAVILASADVIDINFVRVLFPIPFVAAVFAVWWVHSEIGECYPVEFDFLEPFKPLSAWPVLCFDAFEK